MRLTPSGCQGVGLASSPNRKRSTTTAVHFRLFPHLFQLVIVFHSIPALMDSLMGMCEWVSDSRESAWLANPCELRIRITGVLCPHHVGSAYGMAIRTISKRLENHCRTPLLGEAAVERFFGENEYCEPSAHSICTPYTLHPTP